MAHSLVGAAKEPKLHRWLTLAFNIIKRGRLPCYLTQEVNCVRLFRLGELVIDENREHSYFLPDF